MREYDPRDQDARDRDDGICDREEDCLAIERGPALEPESSERNRSPRDRENDRGSIDPRDVLSRDGCAARKVDQYAAQKVGHLRGLHSTCSDPNDSKSDPLSLRPFLTA